MSALITDHITSCLELVLPDHVHPNIHDAPPPPLLNWEHIREFLDIDLRPTHKEAWFMDFRGTRNHFTPRDHFRTVGEQHHLTDTLSIRGLYSNFNPATEDTPASTFQSSYQAQWLQTQKIALTLAANRRVPGLAVTLMLIKTQVVPIWFGEIFLFAADLSVEVLTRHG